MVERNDAATADTGGPKVRTNHRAKTKAKVADTSMPLRAQLREMQDQLDKLPPNHNTQHVLLPKMMGIVVELLDGDAKADK